MIRYKTYCLLKDIKLYFIDFFLLYVSFLKKVINILFSHLGLILFFPSLGVEHKTSNSINQLNYPLIHLYHF
jgi:hypothetical protein